MSYIHDDPNTEKQFNLFQGYKQKYIPYDQYFKIREIYKDDIKIIEKHIYETLCRKNTNLMNIL